MIGLTLTGAEFEVVPQLLELPKLFSCPAKGIGLQTEPKPITFYQLINLPSDTVKKTVNLLMFHSARIFQTYQVADLRLRARREIPTPEIWQQGLEKASFQLSGLNLRSRGVGTD